MLIISDPLENKVLLPGRVFDRPFDLSLPKLSPEEIRSVIEYPDNIIDHENEVECIYYIKSFAGNVTALISAYPV